MLLKAHQLSKWWPALFQTGFVFNQMVLVRVLFCSLPWTLNLFQSVVVWLGSLCARVRVRANAFVYSIFSLHCCCFCWASTTMNATRSLERDSSCNSLRLTFSLTHINELDWTHKIYVFDLSEKRREEKLDSITKENEGKTPEKPSYKLETHTLSTGLQSYNNMMK